MNFTINAAGEIARLPNEATVPKGEEVFTDERSLGEAVNALHASMSHDERRASLARFWVRAFNRLPGVKAVRKFENREIAIKRIVKATCGVQVGTPAPKQPKAAKAPKAAAKAKPAPKGKTKAAAVGGEPREGSKKAQVIELLKQGATRERIQEVVKWQAHSVRGMISTLGKTMKITATKGADKVITYKLEA